MAASDVAGHSALNHCGYYSTLTSIAIRHPPVYWRRATRLLGNFHNQMPLMELKFPTEFTAT